MNSKLCPNRRIRNSSSSFIKYHQLTILSSVSCIILFTLTFIKACSASGPEEETSHRPPPLLTREICQSQTEWLKVNEARKSTSNEIVALAENQYFQITKCSYEAGNRSCQLIDNQRFNTTCEQRTIAMMALLRDESEFVPVAIPSGCYCVQHVSPQTPPRSPGHHSESINLRSRF